MIEEKKFTPKHPYSATIGRGLGYTSFLKVMAAAKNSHVYEDHIQNRFLSQKQLREQRGKVARHASSLSERRDGELRYDEDFREEVPFGAMPQVGLEEEQPKPCR